MFSTTDSHYYTASDIEKREWIAITGHADYYVSRDGLILSTRRGKRRILSPASTSRNGYLSVRLDGRNYYVHTLVSAAFLDPAPSQNFVLCFKNFCKTDCRAENLAWVTNRTLHLHHASKI